MFGLSERGKKGNDAATAVALIGEGYRRTHVRHLLGERVKVEAELASDKRAHMLAQIGPEVVVLDCASGGVNPLLALPDLANLKGAPRVVALTDGSVSHGLDAEALVSLGADATADIRDPRGVADAVLPPNPGPMDPEPTGVESPRHRAALAGATT